MTFMLVVPTVRSSNMKIMMCYQKIMILVRILVLEKYNYDCTNINLYFVD